MAEPRRRAAPSATGRSRRRPSPPELGRWNARGGNQAGIGIGIELRGPRALGLSGLGPALGLSGSKAIQGKRPLYPARFLFPFPLRYRRRAQPPPASIIYVYYPPFCVSLFPVYAYLARCLLSLPLRALVSDVGFLHSCEEDWGGFAVGMEDSLLS